MNNDGDGDDGAESIPLGKQRSAKRRRGLSRSIAVSPKKAMSTSDSIKTNDDADDGRKNPIATFISKWDPFLLSTAIAMMLAILLIVTMSVLIVMSQYR